MEHKTNPKPSFRAIESTTQVVMYPDNAYGSGAGGEMGSFREVVGEWKR